MHLRKSQLRLRSHALRESRVTYYVTEGLSAVSSATSVFTVLRNLDTMLPIVKAKDSTGTVLIAVRRGRTARARTPQRLCAWCDLVWYGL